MFLQIFMQNVTSISTIGSYFAYNIVLFLFFQKLIAYRYSRKHAEGVAAFPAALVDILGFNLSLGPFFQHTQAVVYIYLIILGVLVLYMLYILAVDPLVQKIRGEGHDRLQDDTELTPISPESTHAPSSLTSSVSSSCMF